jgi:arylsulfatase A-like enzyme
MARRFAASLSLLVACSGPTNAGPAAVSPAVASPPAPAAPSAAAEAPRAGAPVLLVLIVDQLASWVLEQRLASLSPDGVFARLRREGSYAPNLRYEHATSSTAPGHAALFTGLPPRESGVFANERLDEKTNKPTSVFADASTQEVLDRPLDVSSSSSALLRADTLADALRRARPSARILAVSLKDRAAIPGGGRRPDAAIWLDVERQSFVSSSAFASALPPWVNEGQASLKQALASVWRPLDELWLAQHASTADDQAGEGDFSLGVRFPYDLSKAKDRAKVFRGQPVADRVLLSLARAALHDEPEGARGEPLLLVLSLSSFDYVGHVYGPDSWESWEALRELDGELGRFLSELERRYGERLSVLLSADHGTTVLPETAGNVRARPWCEAGAANPYELPCDEGVRLYREELEQKLEQAAQKALGPGDWVRGVVEPFAYLTASALALPEPRRSSLERALVAMLEGHPGVARAFPRRSVSAPCPAPPDESLPALVCRSLPDVGGDIYIVSKPGSFFDPHLVHAHGINHGSPYVYDRTVPLFVRTGQRAHAGRLLYERLRPADFTATAAALLGIEPPAGARDGRNLAAP